MYARRVGKEVLDFGHRGWLYEESFLFYDHKTDSLWVQATGQAVYGPYKGTRLARLPATQTPWSEWRRRHPDTLVLGRPPGLTARYWEDSYDTYYATGRGIRYRRDQPLTFGLALVLPDVQKLYPFAEFDDKQIVHDRVGGVPVLIVYLPASRTALAFDRRQDGEVLKFKVVQSGEREVKLADRSTGSIWTGSTGRCVSGPRQGAWLRQLISTQFVVENWPLHYPQAPVYRSARRPASQRQKATPADQPASPRD